MSLDADNEDAKMEALIAEVLTAYPEKFAKRRKKHLSVAKPVAEAAETENALTECDVKSNIKSVPGVMTVRGCAYAGSKGVVWGPIKDMVHISHGPVGCGQYSWSQRRNYYIGKTGIDTFVTMQFTSDFQERHRQVDDLPEHARSSRRSRSENSDRRLRPQGQLHPPHPSCQGAGHGAEPRCRSRLGRGPRAQ